MTELTQETDKLDRGMILEAVESEPVKQGRSLVVTIGINEYVHWQKLKNAVQDAIGLQQTLIDKLGFSAPIPPLINEAATKVAIASLIEDQLREELQEDDNLVLFFAGHGHTRVDKVGDRVEEIGFIVPVEARGLKEVWADYIEIEPLLKSIGRLPARHILVILDSCHSGFALGEAMKIYKSANRYEKDLSSRISRKVITSARREQRASDVGPIPGHSLFTGTLVDGFNWGKADLDSNGLITSSELGLFIQQKVGQASGSRQTPDFGSFYLDERGEMVISLRNQSFDALKARAFSALQSGEFTIFEELVEQIIRLKPFSPESLYLEYRLKFLKNNFGKVIKIITNLSSINFDEGTIPISKPEIWKLESIFPYWLSILAIPESDRFPLNVTLLVDSDEQNIVAEMKKVGEQELYFIECSSIMRFKISNPTQAIVYVYMIEIDSKGIFTNINLLPPEVLFNGFKPGKTVLTSDRAQINEHGMYEIRLFTSTKKLNFFLFPPSPGIKYSEALSEEDLKEIKMKSIRHKITPSIAEC